MHKRADAGKRAALMNQEQAGERKALKLALAASLRDVA